MLSYQDLNTKWKNYSKTQKIRRMLITDYVWEFIDWNKYRTLNEGSFQMEGSLNGQKLVVSYYDDESELEIDGQFIEDVRVVKSLMKLIEGYGNFYNETLERDMHKAETESKLREKRKLIGKKVIDVIYKANSGSFVVIYDDQTEIYENNDI